jgi:hypothetical protein
MMSPRNPLQLLPALVVVAVAASVCNEIEAQIRRESDSQRVIDLNANPGGVLRIFGATPGANLGSGSASNGIAFGDVNGDGVDDMIVGAPTISDTPIEGRAGEAFVVYGTRFLSAGVLDLSSQSAETPPAAGPLQPQTTRIRGRSDGDQAGWAVASGDINGDGYDDVLLGAREAAPGARTTAGEVCVVYGKPDLPGKSIDLGELAAPGGGKTPATSLTLILGDDAYDRAGWSLACDDIDQDGYDDLLLGAPRYIPHGQTGRKSGEVAIVYGGPGLPGTTVDLDTNGAVSAAGETRILGQEGGPEEYYIFGYALAAGDVNGDGFPDVIVGARIAGPAAGAYSGAAYIVYGRENLRGRIIDLRTSGTISPAGETRILGTPVDEWHGSSVAAGDMNGDGLEDVVLGCHETNAPGGEKAGVVYVAFGDSDLPGAILDLRRQSPPHRTGVARILGADAEDRLGASVACADVNGDGLDDLILSACTADPPGGTDAGEVAIVYGQGDLSGRTLDLNSEPSGANVLVLGDNAGDAFGTGGEGGADINGDGWGDCAAGAAFGDNPWIGGDNNSGYAAMALGQGSTVQARVVDYAKPGLAPRRGIGGRLSPTVRAWLGFSAGAGPSSGASATTATLIRGSSSQADRLASSARSRKDDRLAAAPLCWHIRSNRTGLAAGGENPTTVSLTVRYLDSEIGGIRESSLQLYQAPDLAGPWTLVPNQVLNARRNEVTAQPVSLSFFSLRGEAQRKAGSWTLY